MRRGQAPRRGGSKKAGHGLFQHPARATRHRLLVAACLGLAALPAGAELRLSGYLAAEFRAFAHAPLDPRQHGANASLALRPQMDWLWDGGRQGLTLVPFLRADRNDPSRSHADLRELLWWKASREWELRAGIGRVFWGVTESQHLVDIINQTDLVENIDQEDKLGQPMVNLALVRPWGTVDLFLLTGFRERTFPGVGGRLRFPLPVDRSQTRYAGGAGRGHVDGAIRWSRSIGPWDVGLYHFTGTSREPRLVPGRDAAGAPVLVPVYETIDQTGLDLQATLGSWLWKLEAIHRSGQQAPYLAAVGGFEYTSYGVFGSRKDLGWVMEYHYDERGGGAPTPFQNDLMMGLRLAFNDTASTQALLGAVVDLDGGARLYNLEASRRIGQHWKLSVEARLFDGTRPGAPLYGLRRDDYLQVEMAYYF